jgi:hypothetical protein
MKKAALTLTILSTLLFLLVAGIELANVAKVSSMSIGLGRYKFVDPIPGAIPPPIVISSPQNNSVYTTDEVTVSFKISEVKLDEWSSDIIQVIYSLDHSPVELFDITQTVNQTERAYPISPLPEFNTSFSLSSLSSRKHSLKVEAKCIYRRGVTSADYWGEIFFMDSTSTIFFTTATETPTSSPEPTPTIEPTPTPHQELQLTQQEVILGTVIAVAVMATGLGLLVYRIKRK